MSKGVRDLAAALKDVHDEFELDSVSASRRLDDGHTLTMRLSGELLSLEREDGEYVLLSAELLAR